MIEGIKLATVDNIIVKLDRLKLAFKGTLALLVISFACLFLQVGDLFGVVAFFWGLVVSLLALVVTLVLAWDYSNWEYYYRTTTQEEREASFLQYRDMWSDHTVKCLSSAEHKYVFIMKYKKGAKIPRYNRPRKMFFYADDYMNVVHFLVPVGSVTTINEVHNQ